MLDAIKHITYDDFFFFQEDSAPVHPCIVHAVQSNCCSALDQQHLSEKFDFRVLSFFQVVRNHMWHSKASFDCLLYR